MTHGAIILYDATSPINQSVQMVKDCLTEIDRFTIPEKREILIIANKCDEMRNEDRENAIQELAKEHELIYTHTSAKNSYNIEESFAALIHGILLKINKTRT